MSLLTFGFKKTVTKANTQNSQSNESDKENFDEIKPVNAKIKANTLTPRKRQADQDQNTRKRQSMGRKESKINASAIRNRQNTVREPKPGVLTYGDHVHHKFSFLKKEMLRDKRQLPITDDNYDASSLWISPNELKSLKLTPAMKVWWDFKQHNFDTVLFFKVGKFYELYHMDADVGVQHLNLLYMRGNTSHCGFPEISFGKFASKLVSLGYRVGRIEQTETPQMMRERTGKKSGCVQRALCKILTPGTRTISIRHTTEQIQNFEGKTRLLALYQNENNSFSFALCDTTMGKLHFDSFEDDANFMILKTLLLTEDPAEIVFIRGNLSKKTLDLINKMLIVNIGTKGTSLLTDISTNVLRFDMTAISGDLANVIESTGSILAARVCFHYLERCRILKEIISYGDINTYFSNGANEKVDVVDFDEPDAPKMILDSLALSNLDIIPTKLGSGYKNSVFSFINHCCTKFGARNLRKWLIAPLRSIEAIERRHAAIEVFIKLHTELRPIRKRFHKVADIERLLSKAFALGQADDSAILYEAAKFERKKIFLLDTLISTTKSLISSLYDMLSLFKSYDDIRGSVGGQLLISLLQQCKLEETQHSIFGFADDLEGVKKYLIDIEDCDTPEITDIKNKLNTELRKESKLFGKNLSFWKGGVNNDRYQFEVSNKDLPKTKKAPERWELKTTRKGFRRFHTKAIKVLVEELCVEEGKIAQKGRLKLKQAFQQLENLKFRLMGLVLAGRQIDCLWSLSLVSLDGVWSKPKLLPLDHKPILKLEEARHPVIAQVLEMSGAQFVPNSVDLQSVLLLTGANMGGKSTLIRQTCICAILAQVGCYVPASSCEMTLFDRVFTRAGAKDCILEGQSTFAVELFETTVALKNATSRSLVAMDELGRGTSTYDGSAIAYAVLIELEMMGCLAIFSTHYYNVVSSVIGKPRILPKQMKCVVLKEASTEEAQNVTFLYKLVDGSTDNSYGVNVARLAGLPESLLRLAEAKSKEFLEEN